MCAGIDNTEKFNGFGKDEYSVFRKLISSDRPKHPLYYCVLNCRTLVL
jgi:hypothetical protein